MRLIAGYRLAYDVPGHPLDVVVLEAGEAAPRTPTPEPVVYASGSDLRSPMSLGRRWARGTSTGVVETADDNTVALRWLLRHASTAVTGPAATELVAEVTADAVRAEALGEARALAERFEDDGPPELLAALCASLLHRAATGEVADDAASRRTAGAVVDLGQDLRALVWETHRQCGDLALSRRSP